MSLGWVEQADAATAEEALYDLPPLGAGPGFVSFLHMTDCHAQLMPLHFREPSVNLGVGSANNPAVNAVTSSFSSAASSQVYFSAMLPNKYFMRITTVGTISAGTPVLQSCPL